MFSIITGVFTVLFRPGRGASQVETLPRLNWVTQFLTVAYDGVCSPNVYIRMARVYSVTFPCKEKVDDNSRLYVVEIAHVY
jgi:hypothetical protein